MSQKTESPRVTFKDEGTSRECTRYDHPAYGAVTVSRRQGQSRLFGSSLNHQQTIALSISRAHLDRQLSSDFIYPEHRELIEIEMSETQWAKVVASVGLGSGTPVTLRRVPDTDNPAKLVPGIADDEHPDSLHKKELKEGTEKALRETREALEELEALASAPGSVPKGKLKAAVRSMKIRLENAPSNVAHVHSQFVEAMESAKESAKTEVEGYIHGLSLQTGLESLREQGPRLLEKPDRGPEDDQGS
ncbi:hypothetical protein [Thioalkalivibrio sp. ALE16]|uniref:hypothetical protein n=1 Tax=Thioalkalivibrio sp. ALE16 TaxID=1158172 RepID=UPI0003622B58|nr:hypothetical protein [Thioalkalivibrio sp. ALE16]